MTSNNKTIRQRVCIAISSKGYYDFRSLSISAIQQFYKTHNEKHVYQVHCTHPKALVNSGNKKVPFSKIYENLNEALDDFIKIRRKIR
jgi:hypothetical protein|tara:strand:- start:1161 stop:1424 length:264 start_codon:yes stop_codon:yes gene_type:complete